MKILQLEDTEALLLSVALQEYLKQSERWGNQTAVENLAQHPTVCLIIEKLIERLKAEPNPSDPRCRECNHTMHQHCLTKPPAPCWVPGCPCTGYTPAKGICCFCLHTESSHTKPGNKCVFDDCNCPGFGDEK